jgi:hypothetical protein
VKTTPGKTLFRGIVFLSLFMGVQAEDFRYHIATSKQEVYLHEPLQLTVDLKQTNPEVVLLFRFAIEKSPDYEVRALLSKYADTLHHIDQHMVYKIYPLKTGDINISFSLIKRVTTADKVRYFASGDRDDFKKLETIDSKVAIPSIPIRVKSVPLGTQLVGDFNLSYNVTTHHSTSFTPIPMDITIRGRGYPPQLHHLIPKDTHYTLFSEKPTIKTSTKHKDIHSVAHYLFALSAKDSFTLSPINIQAFNPYTKTPYTLTVPEQSFTIDSVDTSMLVDHRDTPAPLTADWTWIQTLFGYVIIFAAGYLSALSIKWTKKKKHKEHHPFVEKIQRAKTAKALLQVLMATENTHFTACIEKLEASIYGTKRIRLKDIKKEALEKIT